MSWSNHRVDDNVVEPVTLPPHRAQFMIRAGGRVKSCHRHIQFSRSEQRQVYLSHADRVNSSVLYIITALAVHTWGCTHDTLGCSHWGLKFSESIYIYPTDILRCGGQMLWTLAYILLGWVTAAINKLWKELISKVYNIKNCTNPRSKEWMPHLAWKTQPPLPYT